MSDKPAVVYVNLYLTIGTNTIQYRAAIDGVATSWTEYTIGFSKFQVVSGSSRTLTQNDVINISKISFGMTYFKSSSDFALHNLLVDNFMFDASVSYSDYVTRTIA